MTTEQKVRAIVEQLRTIQPSDLAPELGSLVSDFQALRGLADLAGVKIPADPLSLLIPDDGTDLELVLDKVICLLLDLRGDDLPPFDRELYGETLVAEFLGA